MVLVEYINMRSIQHVASLTSHVSTGMRVAMVIVRVLVRVLVGVTSAECDDSNEVHNKSGH